MNTIKNYIKAIIGHLFKVYCLFSGILKGKTFIFMYHRVRNENETGSLYDSAMFVSNKSISMHIDEMSKHFDIVPLDTSGLFNTSNTKPNCVLTFDDGWADNYYQAFPILASKKVPATIFVTVNYMDTNKSFWFHNIWNIAHNCASKNLDKEFYAYFRKFVEYNGEHTINEVNVANLISCFKQLEPTELDTIISGAYDTLEISANVVPTMLNWEQVDELNKQGISIGTHGMNHYILTNIDLPERRQEILDSLSILRKKVNHVSDYFCYPNGNYDDATIELVKEAGFKGAIGTGIGFNTSATNKFCLNRIAIHDDISSSIGLLWFRILQSYYIPSINTK